MAMSLCSAVRVGLCLIVIIPERHAVGLACTALTQCFASSAPGLVVFYFLAAGSSCVLYFL